MNECNGFGDTEEKAKEEAAKHACRVLHAMRLLSMPTTAGSSPEPGAIDDVASEHDYDGDDADAGDRRADGGHGSKLTRRIKSTDSLDDVYVGRFFPPLSMFHCCLCRCSNVFYSKI